MTLEVDLYAAMGGPRADDGIATSLALRPSSLAVRCPCGRVVLSVHHRNGESVFVTRTRRLTKAHTAAVLLDAALQDIEVLAQVNADGRIPDDHSAFDVLERFVGLSAEQVAERSPRLMIPGVWRSLEPLMSAWKGEVARAAASRVRPNVIVEFKAPCPVCNKVYYPVHELESWLGLPLADRGGEVMADALLMTKIDAWGWPSAALPRRVALYRQICALL